MIHDMREYRLFKYTHCQVHALLGDSYSIGTYILRYDVLKLLDFIIKTQIGSNCTLGFRLNLDGLFFRARKFVMEPANKI